MAKRHAFEMRNQTKFASQELTNEQIQTKMDQFDAHKATDNTSAHSISNIINLQDSLDDKSNTTHNHDDTYLGKTDKASDSELLDGKDSTDFSLSGHNHDDTYYTESEMDTKLDDKSDNPSTVYNGSIDVIVSVDFAAETVTKKRITISDSFITNIEDI